MRLRFSFVFQRPATIIKRQKRDVQMHHGSTGRPQQVVADTGLRAKRRKRIYPQGKKR